MTLKDDLTSLKQRLIDLAERFDAGARESMKAQRLPPGVQTTWDRLRDFFTEGVTREELQNLLRRDTGDTLRFYIREIDFESLRARPWYLRYPEIVWKTFLAMAYRLSPPRRIAFAAAAVTFVIGWLQLLAPTDPARGNAPVLWWSLTTVILLLLLLMELRDKLDMKGDLEIAREIQLGLVPSQPFALGEFEIHSHMRPANTVGGDYHDICRLGDDRLGIVIGDVAGKGMPAALLMALLQGSLRTLITAGLRGPELIAQLNRYLCANIPQNSFITFFYGELDLGSGDIRYVNAGHNAPFLIGTGGGVRRLPSTSIVLGFSADARFEAGEVRLEPGTSLLLFTDGLPECFNAAGEEYGEERLSGFLERHGSSDPKRLIGELNGEVLRFCDGVRPRDDLTVMLVRRQPASH